MTGKSGETFWLKISEKHPIHLEVTHDLATLTMVLIMPQSFKTKLKCH